MSQTICRHGNRADNMIKAYDKRVRRQERNELNERIGPLETAHTPNDKPFTSNRPKMRRAARKILQGVNLNFSRKMSFKDRIIYLNVSGGAG